MTAIATFHEIYFRYSEEENWILQDLSLSVQKGEWVAVIGPNGSGKSTLAKLFNGLLLPEKGRVVIDNKETANEEDIPTIRQRVGMVFQNPDHQFVAPTVRDDLAFGMENAGINRSEMKIRIENVSTKTGITDLLDYEPHRLSGGQKQRVAIAGILALNPQVMIFDEATSMLDPKGRKEVIETIRKLHHEKEVTVIMITHSFHDALAADRILYIEDGAIIKDSTPMKMIEELSWVKEKGIPLPFGLELYFELDKRGHTMEAAKVLQLREEF
ncbi:energy-coupling factor transporter ATPase [Bacillus sp. FJAT-44742]|uniref:energy-coupling factor transporter ATPase n=1 Tax=Bacillus sp. FJAT-44742 TaxID=2014005 RepID=UPI000C2396C5|nr:energy-coupling factor transporter ATPase [Bacillus sp. FJAT-44742]